MDGEVGQLLCESRSGQRLFMIEASIFDKAEQWYTHGGLATFSSIKPLKSFFIDGGGAIMLNEPTVTIAANNVNISTFKRHVPYILEMLMNLEESKVQDCVVFSGGIHIYIISVVTKALLVDELWRIYDVSKHEIRELEDNIYNGLEQSGILYLGKCSCLSGKLYKECCGTSHLME